MTQWSPATVGSGPMLQPLLCRHSHICLQWLLPGSVLPKPADPWPCSICGGVFPCDLGWLEYARVILPLTPSFSLHLCRLCAPLLLLRAVTWMGPIVCNGLWEPSDQKRLYIRNLGSCHCWDCSATHSVFAPLFSVRGRSYPPLLRYRLFS